MGVSSKIPYLVVKESIARSERPNGFIFAACVDGSSQSMQALYLICDYK
jgi:hypothetical protein